jgi:hypothetical protein
VHNVSDVRQIEVYTAEQLVPGSSRHEVEIAVAKFRKCKSPGSDQILAELIPAGGKIRNKKELPDQWKESVIVPVHKKGDKILTVIIIVVYYCYQLHIKFYRISSSQG